jgi:hypothetical protein
MECENAVKSSNALVQATPPRPLHSLDQGRFTTNTFGGVFEPLAQSWGMPSIDERTVFPFHNAHVELSVGYIQVDTDKSPTPVVVDGRSTTSTAKDCGGGNDCGGRILEPDPRSSWSAASSDARSVASFVNGLTTWQSRCSVDKSGDVDKAGDVCDGRPEGMVCVDGLSDRDSTVVQDVCDGRPEVMVCVDGLSDRDSTVVQDMGHTLHKNDRLEVMWEVSMRGVNQDKWYAGSVLAVEGMVVKLEYDAVLGGTRGNKKSRAEVFDHTLVSSSTDGGDGVFREEDDGCRKWRKVQLPVVSLPCVNDMVSIWWSGEGCSYEAEVISAGEGEVQVRYSEDDMEEALMWPSESWRFAYKLSEEPNGMSTWSEVEPLTDHDDDDADDDGGDDDDDDDDDAIDADHNAAEKDDAAGDEQQGEEDDEEEHVTEQEQQLAENVKHNYEFPPGWNVERRQRQNRSSLSHGKRSDLYYTAPCGTVFRSRSTAMAFLREASSQNTTKTTTAITITIKQQRNKRIPNLASVLGSPRANLADTNGHIDDRNAGARSHDAPVPDAAGYLNDLPQPRDLNSQLLSGARDDLEKYEAEMMVTLTDAQILETGAVTAQSFKQSRSQRGTDAYKLHGEIQYGDCNVWWDSKTASGGWKTERPAGTKLGKRSGRWPTGRFDQAHEAARAFGSAVKKVRCADTSVQFSTTASTSLGEETADEEQEQPHTAMPSSLLRGRNLLCFHRLLENMSDLQERWVSGVPVPCRRTVEELQATAESTVEGLSSKRTNTVSKQQQNARLENTHHCSSLTVGTKVRLLQTNGVGRIIGRSGPGWFRVRLEGDASGSSSPVRPMHLQVIREQVKEATIMSDVVPEDEWEGQCNAIKTNLGWTPTSPPLAYNTDSTEKPKVAQGQKRKKRQTKRGGKGGEVTTLALQLEDRCAGAIDASIGDRGGGHGGVDYDCNYDRDYDDGVDTRNRLAMMVKHIVWFWGNPLTDSTAFPVGCLTRLAR